MKNFTLALLIMGASLVAAETAQAAPVRTTPTNTTVYDAHHRGIWGIFKGKKYNKHRRPAYSRLR